MYKKATLGDPKSLARKPKTKAESLGQVFTTDDIAQQMVAGLGLTGVASGTLLDPCVGPATFLKSLVKHGVSPSISIHAYDVDLEMIDVTAEWATGRSDIKVSHGDYLQISSESQFNFAILNPPYVRQEWIERKQEYRELFKKRYGLHVPGTANLYVYFIAKVLADLVPGGRMACVVYDSWQSTKYGLWLKDYLLSTCELLEIKPIHGVPFEGRMIDATIIFATKGKNDGSHTKASETTANASAFTSSISGLQSISELFHTKRGLRLKQADFFLSNILNREFDGGLPFIKKVNLVPGYSVLEDHPESALLVTGDEKNEKAFLELQRRLQSVQQNPGDNVSILTWHRERPASWHLHGSKPWAPLLFNYYLRNRPRHIFNEHRIYSDNFYGLLPKGDIEPYAWLASLNSTLSTIGVMEKTRNQGAGLAKIQLFEYRTAQVVDLTCWDRRDIAKISKLGQRLATVPGRAPELIEEIDSLIFHVLGNKALHPAELSAVLTHVDSISRRPKVQDC